MKSLEQINHDNAPKRAKGDVATGRAIRKRSARFYAKAQLEGGVPWGEVWMGGPGSLFVCQKCGGEYHLSDGGDPCAFCDGCKDEVLDILAEALLALSPVAKALPVDRAADAIAERVMAKHSAKRNKRKLHPKRKR